MIKRIFFAAAALALVATAASAGDEQNDHKAVADKTVVDKTVVRRPVVDKTVDKTVVNRTVVNRWPARSDFRQGGYIAQNDWRGGRVIDYRVAHLRAPPPGYEWREVGGRYILAAVATGLIADIIMSSQ